MSGRAGKAELAGHMGDDERMIACEGTFATTRCVSISQGENDGVWLGEFWLTFSILFFGGGLVGG